VPQRHLEERSLDKYFDSIRDLPLLTAEEERINGRLWQNDRNPEGLRYLVEGNLRFVVKEARKFQGMGLDLLDLISEGNLGLIEAAKRFDPERENKFLTYASWWVRQAIFHALAEHGSKIRLPRRWPATWCS
jgi:RNA polymerase primary sigma factor